MNQISLITLEWNIWNGFIFEILSLDINKPNIDSALFGIYVGDTWVSIDLFFIKFKIF